ncbi:ChbG/HpnK family deacetylase [Roseomonas eburnea]|uniref:ChbG/HpnK family deacetylase n=1 Tax=Neoroseomonas eburnea TaxID=1346889 RepID=A0A9X9XIY0_9PROT|nr:ChbG/HpnK family deacetylase [Neoroseomonas eburnea]MBR0683666.1 ChbG/HpnK family deacetylase [Neoroseomonas eburnea]
MAGSELAQRLGFDREARLLIVNCDDLGSSHAANLATHRALSQGIATDATLMVPCPWAPEAVRLCRGFPIGVHLTLTSEYEGYRWRGLTRGASLHDADGFLPRSAAEALGRLAAEDARAECLAQIETALSWGVDVTHLDAHMGVMQDRADLFAVYLDLAARFRLPVRMAAAEDTAQQGFGARERAAARGILFNERMLCAWPTPAGPTLREALPTLPPGVTEIFAHPALDGEELHGYGAAFAALRIADAAALVDPALRAFIERHGVQRIGFLALREAQRQPN